METPDEIWDGDLYARRAEAEDLIGYLESVATRPAIREDGHAHVLAVDGQYGEGKTYFLRRFARNMAITHPVAFVDAWVDDLEDEPLVALAATLETALDPYLNQDPTLRDEFIRFRDTAGRVAKIAAIGLGKRLAGLALTQTTVELLGEQLTSGSGGAATANKDAAKDVGKGIVSDVERAMAAPSLSSMADRIALFRKGKEAIEGMKADLSRVVARLDELGIQTPVTIVIDELDRCRPTYAIKLLEEIKHLFDVSGVAFVLGMHAGQLTHSVTAAYGTGFDSQSYLRRFFNRRYSLKPAPLEALIQHLMRQLGINENRLVYPYSKLGNPSTGVTAARVIAEYMAAYRLTSRDTFELMEMLQTALALTENQTLYLPYLLPLSVAHMKGVTKPPDMVRSSDAMYLLSKSHFGHAAEEVAFQTLFEQIESALTLDHNALLQAFNNENGSTWGVRIAGENEFSGQSKESLARFRNYRRLLDTVRRFSSNVIVPVAS
jgi:AraC-like DNA-binding protein